MFCCGDITLSVLHNTGDSTTAQEDEENVMMSPAVTSIKEMGYSEGKIKAAINKIKSRQPRGNAAFINMKFDLKNCSSII